MRALTTGRGPILAAAVLGIVGLSASTFAASGTWLQAGADGNFATGTNWDIGTPPGDPTTTNNTDTATFGRNTAGVNSTVIVDANRNLQNILLNPTNAGGTTFAYAFTGGPFVLTDGGSITTINTTVGLNSSSFATDFKLQGNYTITADFASTRTLTLSGGVTGSAATGNTSTFTLQGGSGGTHISSGIIGNGGNGGALAVTKAGANTWELRGANVYTGGTTITGGTLLSTNATPVANLSSGAVTLNGGTLRLSGSSSTFVNPLVVGPAGGFFSTKANTFSPSSITGTGALNVTADTNSTVTFTDFKGFAGTINFVASTGGTLFARQASAFVNNSLLNAAVDVGTGVQFSKQNGVTTSATVDIGRLSGLGTDGGSAAGAGTFFYSVGARNEPSTFGGTFVNGSTKTGLIKVGSAALTLTSVNSYTGNTTVTGGTLALSGAGSIASSVSIAIGAAGTLDTTAAPGFALASGQALALSGTFAGTLAANATTTITPGAAATVGTANVNNTTLVAGSSLTADVSSATSDLLNVAGTIDLGGATLTLNKLASPTAIGLLYTLVANDGTDPTVGTFNGLADGATVTAGVDSYTLRYNAFGGNDVTLTSLTAAATAVPEPASLAAVGLAGSMLLKRRRRA